MRTPKENKQKLRDLTPKSTAGTIPKAALKTAWIKTKEQTRTAARENDTDPRQQEPTDFAGSVAEQAAAFVWHQGRKLAETQARQHRQKEAVARAHAAGERGVSPKQAECGTLPDAAQRPRRGADLPRQRAKEKAVTTKTAPRDIRGVTQGQRQLRTAANETVRSVMPQAQMQTHAQKIRLAAQKVAGGTGRTAVAVRSAIRNFFADLHSLTAILAAGVGAALGIVIVISLVAFVSGSAYGIFFTANAPNAASVTVREAVETLTEEYRDRLEEISDTVQHDRQDITANDDVYYIRWQDVLAVFSSYVSGNEQGAPVAALTEEQVDKLRETMWAMNAVDYAIRAETAVIGLRSMLDAVENGRIEAVMVRDLEQISRNSYILVGVIEILRQNDVYLITTECDLNAELINSGLERFVGDRFTRASFGKPRFDVRLPLMDQF